MGLVDWKLEGHVAVITWNNGENRFNPDFLKANLDALDAIENTTAATALMVTSAHEKIWSNGLDLDWLMPVVQAGDKETSMDFFFRLNEVFKRFLMFPGLTLASINGHVFAGGAILACAFDFRFMRTDRGFFCFPEVDISIPFLPGMLALMRKALPGHSLVDMALTGKRMTAKECLEAGVVQAGFEKDRIYDESLAWIKTHNKGRKIVAAIKKELYKEVVRIIDEEDPPVIRSGRLNV
ncbi:MAG: enoyl-CoA hydratase/isomerase family protein [Deltaproteobacteria bacterium]|nr:enoyl-CoA hydratase/isomerase family protein [Deltaproteobacteria bacterium]